MQWPCAIKNSSCRIMYKEVHISILFMVPCLGTFCELCGCKCLVYEVAAEEKRTMKAMDYACLDICKF